MSALIYLPDEVLLYILAYLSHKDLSNLSQTCCRFWNLTKYKPLWETIDLSSMNLSLDRFRKVLRLFQKTSKHVTIRGLAIAGSPRWKSETVSRYLLSKLALTCPKIESIQLLEVYFSEKTKFIHFPSSLGCVTLHNCQFASTYAFFNSKRIPTNLRHLNISDCSGITHRSLLVICKWLNLESLSLENCYNVTDNMLIHMTTSLKNLRSLDLRGTDTSDMIVIHIGLEMKNLEKLRIGGNPGNHLSNTRNLISDGGILCLDHIAANFTSLDLSNTSVTNESLVFIQETCHSLCELVIRNTDVTVQAVATLKTKLPNCKVIC